MGRYVLQRLGYLAVILVLLSVLIFAITQVLPGNAAIMILGNYRSEEVIRALEARLGLDHPLPVQYWRWVSRFVRGDMGESLSLERPVAPMVTTALGNTLTLAILSIVCVAVIGIGLGIIAAVKHNQPIDYLAAVGAFAGISLPEFFWGIVLIVLFAGYFQILPSTGMGSFRDDPVTWVKHLIMPVATLTFALLAHVSRLTRSSMLEVLQSNYIRAARAKGLPERMVILKHALRNALLPTITVIAHQFTFLIGEVVVVESVFAYPGFGRLTIEAIQNRDLPIIQACGLTVAIVACLTNLTADMLYAFVDPKIRYGAASEV